MKNIEKWLKENEIEYRREKHGNSIYFNDGFNVDGIQIAFYWDGIGNDPEKRHALERFMKRKRAYICNSRIFGAGITYTIMTVFDAARLEKHETAIKEASEKFWKEEHARRMQKASAI